MTSDATARRRARARSTRHDRHADTDDRDEELGRHRAAIDALDREILARLNERAAHAQAIGALKGGGAAYRPEREAQVLRAPAGGEPGPLPNEAVAGIFRQVMSACLALEQTLRIAYLGPAGTFSHAAVGKHFGAVRRRACRARRSTTCSARPRAGRPTTPSCRSRIRPRARSAARSTSCARPTLVDLRRDQAARPAEPAVERAATLDDDHARLFARAVARAVRAVARAHLPAVPRVAGGEQRRGRAPRRGRAGRRGDRRRDRRGDLRARRRSRRTSRTSRTTRRASGCWAASASPPSGRDETSLVMSAPNRPGAVHALLEPLREARRVA